MAASDKRRQKKLEAKRSKRKEQQKAVARIESSGVNAKIKTAQNWEIVDSLITMDYAEKGIANAILVRRGPFEQVAAVMFLVDLFCLGVKDVAIFVGQEGAWNQRLAAQKERGMQLAPVAPELLRKIVEGSVAFARSFGLAPYHDWAKAALIFGNIDASECLTEVTFGRNGKPMFIEGPYDTSERIQRIMNTISQHSDGAPVDFLLGEEVFDEDDEEEEDGEEEFADQWKSGRIIEIPKGTTED